MLRSPAAVITWEQKLVTKTFKSVVENVVVIWRFNCRSDLADDIYLFYDLEVYGKHVNNISSPDSFILGICPYLLRHANNLASKAANKGY